MKLRTRFDLFSTALLSALGATQLVACGGRALSSLGDGAGFGALGSDNANTGGASTDGESGANTGAANSGGASTGGVSSGTAGAGGASAGGGGHSGSAQNSAGTASAAGSAGEGPNSHPCLNPEELGYGFVQCAGFRHRREIGTCPSSIPRPDPIPGPTRFDECIYDAECTAQPYGWCFVGYQLGEAHCEYGCLQDSDCADNQLCECGPFIGRCLKAECTTDADCRTGYFCRDNDVSGGCGPTTYACQTAGDTCTNDSDCNPPPPAMAWEDQSTCRFDAEAAHFQCIPGGCVIGRPFLVGGTQRLSQLAARADWSELALLPELTGLTEVLRTRLGQEWTRIALMEHASIAAFARFTLQLLSLGAPAQLIEQASAAMVDETKHAKACFALASAYARAPLGPGPLAVEHSLDDSALIEIVLNTIHEGCVGETVAAIEAREAAEHASDPALRELLLLISDDETRHAELAYRFLKWALSLGNAQLEQAVRRELALLAAEPLPARAALSEREGELLRHGIVPDALRRLIRGRALTEVILPCSLALFRSETRRAAAIQLSAASTRSSAS